jgi:hypothetical protein
MPPSEKRSPMLDDPALAKAIREGLITPVASPTGKPPPRNPIMSFEELMEDLQRDRENR